MKTAKEIREKCKEDIEKLQKICKHPNSSWCLDWSLGIGHTTGEVLVCNICEKILKRR